MEPTKRAKPTDTAAQSRHEALDRAEQLDELCALVQKLSPADLLEGLPLCRAETGWVTPYLPLSDEGTRLFSNIVQRAESVGLLIRQLHGTLRALDRDLAAAAPDGRWREDLFDDEAGHTGASAAPRNPHGVGAPWRWRIPNQLAHVRELLPSDPEKRLEAFKALHPTGRRPVEVVGVEG